MVLALLFSLMVISAGFATLRALGLAKGAIGLGLAPPAGLAVLAVVSSWCMLLGVPPQLTGVVIIACAAAGLGVAVHDRHSISVAARTLVREHRVSVAVLLAALVVPFVAMGFAFAGVQVPLSPHDGAFHVEAIEAYRLGVPWVNWYPPGMAALFAAWLQAVPWVDSAEGAFDLGLSLPTLAGLAVFGLGVAVWHDLRIASASALLLGFTYVYPYFPELWSGWPLALSLVLVIGIWTIGLVYLDQPSPRWAVLAGLMLGAVVLVHGTELYTVAVVLAVVCVAAVRRVPWRCLPRDLGSAAVLMVACAAPYVPTLVHWAGTGGAYAVGYEDGQGIAASSVSSIAVSNSFVVFGLGALGIDLPIRLIAVVVGVVRAFYERRGRSVLVLGGLLAAGAAMFSLLNWVQLIHQAYAVVFPWGMHYRMFMVVAIAQSLVAGAGWVVALRWVQRIAGKPSPWARRLGRLVRLVVVTWLALMVWATAAFVAYPAGLVLGYGPDDAAAMAWLREHALPGSVLANDGYADAGIWTPYKAGLPILLPRLATLDTQLRAALVIDNVAQLDQLPAAAASACAQNVRYVLSGSRTSEWDKRRFPSLAELRSSPALEEVFSSHEAAVFRLRLAC